jgi:hypothetical protein
MTEETLFGAALEKGSPAERATFLAGHSLLERWLEQVVHGVIEVLELD